MKIGITCYPTYGGSGVVATELGKALAGKGHTVHFISYSLPFRLREFSENIVYHEVEISTTIQDFHPLKEVVVIPNFVDTKEFVRRDCTHYRTVFAKADEKLLIHISNFRPVKRVRDVIRAFALIEQKVPSRLLLVGDGPERSEAERLSRELGITERVKFLGKQEAVVELLSISDLMLMTSETESFGLAALEAMACSVPVVAYKVGGLPELIRDGDNGYTVPKADVEALAARAIEVLINSPLYARMAHCARETALRYDTACVIPLYEKFYKQVLAQ
jgi:N-acetyl-alpha-D-glucosaminyl L-malate synthase BshA